MQKKNKSFRYIIVASVILAATDIHSFRIIRTSIPKCGSHLLNKTFEYIQNAKETTPNQPITKKFDPQLLTSLQKNLLRSSHYHLHYNYENLELVKNEKLRLLFIYRDPRDQILSLIPYIKKLKSKIAKEAMKYIFCMDPEVLNLSEASMRTYLIHTQSKLYKIFMPWKDHPHCYALKFEDLVGAEGGGTREAQIREIHNIARHMGINISEKRVLYIANNLFGGTSTFRKGQIGQWKTEFTAQEKDLCKKYFGQLLIDLGYEKDFNW